MGVARAHAAIGDGPRQVIGLAQQVLGLRVLAQRRVLAAERDEHLDVVLVGLPVAFDDVRGAAEELGGGERLGRWSGVREQERVEIADGLGARKLSKGEIALRARGARLLIGTLTLTLGERRLTRRASRLGEGADQT